MLGRVGCKCPTFIIIIAPACSGVSVCIEWMKADDHRPVERRAERFR
jgi:hypothetical protein